MTDGTKKASASIGHYIELPKQFVTFVLVGGVGFGIDAILLTMLFQYLEVNVYFARAVSFSFASLGTWLLNRAFTFREARNNSPASRAEYFRYMAIQIAGAIVNLMIFTLLLLGYPSMVTIPVVPLGIGALFGLIVNYGGSRFWVYSQRN